MGIRFACNYRVGKEHQVEDFFRHGLDLVFLGYGAVKGGEMKVPGGDTLKNIYQATEYLVWGNLPPERYLTFGAIYRPPSPIRPA
jgi:NADPH-dependent glutamate synthase beta subunit-like oxidoreductase